MDSKDCLTYFADVSVMILIMMSRHFALDIVSAARMDRTLSASVAALHVYIIIYLKRANYRTIHLSKAEFHIPGTCWIY